MNMRAAVYSDVKFGWVVASGTSREMRLIPASSEFSVASQGHGGAPGVTPRVQTLLDTKASVAGPVLLLVSAQSAGQW